MTKSRRFGPFPRDVICLGIISLATAGVCAAQTPPRLPRHLTVRPRELATGARTVQPGLHQLDSLPRYSVYVPPQCGGPRRCPLVVYLNQYEWQELIADKYGMILLVMTVVNGQAYDLDAALQQLLTRFPIDPAKLAIVGRCGLGSDAAMLGGLNLDVFSRIAVVSGGGALRTNVDPPNNTAEFFFASGFLESGDDFRGAEELRRQGHRVTQVLGFRQHEAQWEDSDLLGHWLALSWATPDPRARPAPAVVADPLPLLTTRALTQLTTFWTRFQQEPDSIRTAARRAHLREVAVPIGKDQVSAWMVDMVALAAQHPSVAAALKAAGLTAAEHDVYRLALISASTTKELTVDAIARAARDTSIADLYKEMNMPVNAVDEVPAISLQGKNIVFLVEHPDELERLAQTGM